MLTDLIIRFVAMSFTWVLVIWLLSPLMPLNPDVSTKPNEFRRLRRTHRTRRTAALSQYSQGTTP